MAEVTEKPKSADSKTSKGKKEHHFQRFPTNIDEVAQNAVWREFCAKLDANEVQVTEFTINPLTTVPITEKPTRVVPSVKVSKEEFKEAKQLLEDLYPIKNLDVVPPDKYEVPLTNAQEYGWCSKPLVKPKKAFQFPRHTCDITQFAAAYLEAMHTTPFSKKGFVPRYVLKEQALLAAQKAAAAEAAAQAAAAAAPTEAASAPPPS